MNKAFVFWFTGLSGSGKTTIAGKVEKRLLEMNKAVKVFDGDVVRREINTALTFSPQDIEKNNRIIAELCLKSIGTYNYILVPIISPFSRSRRLARDMIGKAFNLVYVKASLEEVTKRDVKGLYKKAANGYMENFIGVDKNVLYEEPDDADIIIDTENENVEDSVYKFMLYIESLG